MISRIVQSWDNSILLQEGSSFLEGCYESLAILPARSPGEGMAVLGTRLRGAHALTLPQLAAELARPGMAEQGLVPISSLGMEAVCARVIHLSVKSGEL